MSNGCVFSLAELHDIVLATYQEVLGAQDVAPGDDFFEIGGDSVKGVVMLERLRDQVGVRLPISTLFMRRTVDELSDEIAATLAG